MTETKHRYFHIDPLNFMNTEDYINNNLVPPLAPFPSNCGVHHIRHINSIDYLINWYKKRLDYLRSNAIITQVTDVKNEDENKKLEKIGFTPSEPAEILNNVSEKRIFWWIHTKKMLEYLKGIS